jgi:hypothetical protein
MRFTRRFKAWHSSEMHHTYRPRIFDRPRAVITDRGRNFEKENVMNITNETVLITGSNRGVGQARVHEA